MFGPPIPSVRADEVADDAYLLDVREPDEYAAGHAPDARHVPMMEIPARLADVPTDEDVVVVCRSGGRSGQVVAYLKANGWDNVRNLAGGMQDWARTGRPVIGQDGQPGHVL
jgi:rhodanese-related sulfurtransferase